MMNIQNMTLRDYVDIAIRRKWIVLSAIVLAVAASWIICLALPKSYRSSTLILVETPKIPESYVNPVVRGSVADRLSMIQQQVLSRTVLSQVIDQFQLFGDRPKTEGYEAVIEAMRKNIKIETKGGVRGIGNVEAFSISFGHADPVIAMKVTERLTSQFIEENLRVREQLVEGTTEFLEVELKRAKESLEEQEQAIANFKKKFMGELPGQTEANLQTLNRLQKDLAGVMDQLQNRRDRRAAVQKMLNAYETLGLAMLDPLQNPPNAGASPDQTVVARGAGRKMDGPGGDPFAGRLKELERTLSSLKAEYKDTYPDVIHVRQEIAMVKAKLSERSEDTDREREREEQPKDRVTSRHGKPSGTTVVDPYLHELRREREENDIGIQALTEQQRKLTAQIKEYERRVEKAPEREQDMLVLQRDYDNSKKNYQALFEKQLSARISENLEKRQKGESFRVLDPANMPSKPESPDQPRIMLMGLLIGCGLGYGAAFVLEHLAGVFRRPEDIESVLGLPVLANIPHFKLAYESEFPVALPAQELRAEPKGAVQRAALIGRVGFGETAKGSRLPWKKKLAQNGTATTDNGGADALRQELTLVTKWRPKSIVAEQFRVAATRLVLSMSGQKNSVIVITSAVTGEGKSATASNLAYVLAQDLGKPTILIDCDFKKPVVHSYTGVPGKPGLVEAIYGDAPLESCIHRSGEAPLWILPSGRRDHRLVDLTKIPQVTSIIAECRQRYEFIIVDAPPIFPLADMNLLGALADMLVLVVRTGATPQELVQKGLKTLKHSGRTGVIMTGYSETSVPSYMHDYYLSAKGSYLR